MLGHRNPDTDAVCSAIGYATLMRLQGHPDAVPGRQGPLRAETEYLLQRFGVLSPDLIDDVRPRVGDLMTSPAASVHENTALADVGRILEERNIRVVAVVDKEGRLLGVTGQADFARTFVSDIETLDRIPLQRDNLVHALGGKVLVESPSHTSFERIMVGAMGVESMVRRLRPGDLVVMGDRTDAQRAAIECHVGGLIITGDDPVAEEIVELAGEKDVLLVTVPHHTFTTLRLVQLSVPVRQVMQREVATCHPDDLAEDARDELRTGSTRSLMVVDDANRVVGIISRSNLLRTVRRRVVLVDHNERGQAVVGIEDADVVAVIDHHRVADFWTRTPPYMRLEPVGATSTIVAKLFEEARIAVPPPIAGILLGAILTDTLLFRSPTTTPEDRRVAGTLAGIAEVDPRELGDSILQRASDVSGRSTDELLSADFKEFTSGARRFGIGVIETANGAAVLARADDLRASMDRKRQQGFDFILFAVIDIVHETTHILISGHPDAVASAFSATLEDGWVIEVAGILSRKKNIVPLLGDISRAIDEVA